MRSQSTLDDSTKAILQFSTTGDIDKFLNMPMDKKLSLADVQGLGEVLATKLEPQLVDINLMRDIIDSGNFSKFINKYQGFWTQKQSTGCVQPASTYQVNMACVNRHLYMFAEQKIGSAPVNDGPVQSAKPKAGASAAFKAFNIDIVTKSS